MNRKIVVIESPDFIMDVLEEIAAAEGDELTIVSNEGNHHGRKHWIKIDVRKDYETALQLVREQVGEPSAVITTQEMFLTQAAQMAHDFGLLRNPLQAIHVSRDKTLMKEVWSAAGVRTPQGAFYASAKALKEDAVNLRFPVIVKPSLGYASCGVKKVGDAAELQDQLRKIFLINSTVVAKEKLQNVGFLVEEYVDGDEFSVDTLWMDGEPVCNGILSKGNAQGPYYPDRVYYQDPHMSEEQRQKILDLSHAAVKAIGIVHGATHTEIRFKGDEPYVLETTSRPGAGGIFYELFEQAHGIDFHKIHYLLFVSRDREELRAQIGDALPSKATDVAWFWYNMPHEGSGIIKEIHGLDELRARPEIRKVMCYKKPGGMLYQDDLNSDYFCSLVGAFRPGADGEDIQDFVKQYDRVLQIVY
jgi:D-alanine-D-alanine ligase-like ATP-grasp enzyme